MTSAALLDDIAAFDRDEVRRARQFCFVGLHIEKLSRTAKGQDFAVNTYFRQS
jgi:hypothetical protein